MAKNQVCWTWFFQLDFSKTKYRSTGGHCPNIYTVVHSELTSFCRTETELKTKYGSNWSFFFSCHCHLQKTNQVKAHETSVVVTKLLLLLPLCCFSKMLFKARGIWTPCCVLLSDHPVFFQLCTSSPTFNLINLLNSEQQS